MYRSFIHNATADLMMQLVHCTKLLSKIIQKSLEYVLQENTISVFLLQNSVLAVYFLYKLKITSDF